MKFKSCLGLPALLVACLLAASSAEPAGVVIVDADDRPAKQLVGVFYVDNGHVAVEPPLRAKILGDADIRLVCGFHLDGADSAPVDVRLSDAARGTGQFFAKHQAVGDLSRLGLHNFNVSARDCEGRRSPPVPMSLRAEKFALPTFSQKQFVVKLRRDAPIGAMVTKLTAAQKQVGVCNYAIDGGHAIFDIDGAGVVRTRATLPKSGPSTYRLSVTAFDCDVPKAKSATVELVVEMVESRSAAETSCTTEWKGLSGPLVGQTGGAPLFFASKAELPDCQPKGSRCRQVKATLRVEVNSGSSGECGRSETDLRRQRQLCGVSSSSLDLLATNDASSSEFCPAAGVRDFDESHEAFDVQQATAGHVGENFTMHFWLQHGKMRPGGPKEQIVCSADTSGHNRHHYSLFLHNCKLLLLVRNEATAQGELRAAEWRFRLREVCDDRWHHYGVVRLGETVRLLVDGVEFNGEPEVLEDRPMPSPGEARTTVGACWHAVAGVYSQPLIGRLAGLVLLPRAAEPTAALACLSACSPILSLRSVTRLPTGATVSLSADSSVAEAVANNASSVAKLLQQVSLVSTGAAKEVALKVTTAVSCADSQAGVSVPAVRLSASFPPAKRLCLSGSRRRRVSASALASTDGVVLLPDVDIRSSEPLKACSLRTSPELTAVESIAWPAGTAADFKVEVRLSDHNHLMMDGEASAERYLQLLKRIRYRNSRPLITYRTFVLACLAHEVTSNQLIVELDVLGKLPAPEAVEESADRRQPSTDKSQKADAVKPAAAMHPRQQQSDESVVVGGHFARSHVVVLPHVRPGSNDGSFKVADGGGLWAAAPALIGVMTVGLVLTVVSLAIYRFRCRPGQQKRQQQQQQQGETQVHCRPGKSLPIDAESQEMEWDNAGLSITVNPLDEQTSSLRQPLLTASE